MKLINIVLTLSFLILINSCGFVPTKYIKNNMWGGYSETQLSDSVYTVTFRGNNFTKIERVNDLCLLHCADITFNNGYSYFEIIDNSANRNINDSKRRFLYSHNTIKLLRTKANNNTQYYDAVFIQKSIKTKYKLK